MEAPEEIDLLALAEELYALPPGEFTAARDARAKELGRERGKRVKALKRPSTAAWVVDLLVRRESEQVDQVLTLGAALREAAESLDGAELRALARQRRQLTAAVTGQARRVAAEHGVKVSDAVADQVEATLTAAMLDATAAEAVRSGLLVTALAPTGTDAREAVALPEALGHTATPRAAEPAPRPDLTIVPDPEPDETARREAAEALERADSEVATARAAAEQAATAVADLEAETLRLQAEMEELRGRLADLELRAERVDDDLTEAEDARDEAESALAQAVTERDRAASYLGSL